MPSGFESVARITDQRLDDTHGRHPDARPKRSQGRGLKGLRPVAMEACNAEMMKYVTTRPLLRARARARFDEMRKLPNTDLGRMAAIG